MPTIRFSRGDAYVAGDMIIQIYIDGVKRGSLIGAKPLDLNLPPNLYTIQARMLGVHRGETIVLPVNDNDGDMTVLVSGTRAGILNSASLTVAWFAVMLMPHKPQWLYVAGIVLLSLLGAVEIYRWRKLKPQLLRLSVSEGVTSGSRASSTRPSSLR